jgi:histone H3/H4
VELAEFVDALRRLSGDDLRAVACAIDEHRQTVADEVAAWEDVMCIYEALRHAGRSRAAARAAHEAVQAVRSAAEATDLEIPSAVVIRIAREAALLARALVAGTGADPAVQHLSRIWGRVASAAA